MTEEIVDLESRIAAIEARNVRVEEDKSWEVSLTRRLTISAATYLAAALYLSIISASQVLLTALIPAGAYLISVLSLPWVRKVWKNFR